MAVAIKVPSVGESISEGVLAQWLKKDGELVKESEPLFELETDKATQSIPAPATGILHITVSEGQNVNIGAEVGRIDPREAQEARETPKGPRDERKGTPPLKEGSKVPKEEPKKTLPINEQHREPNRDDRKVGEPITLVNEEFFSPAVRRLVQEEGVDLAKITGTGRSGRVTKEDVIRYLEQERASKTAKPPDQSNPSLPAQEPKPGHPPPPREMAEPVSPKTEPVVGEHRQRMSPIRQRIAQRMLASQQTTATLTTFNEADLSAVMELRSRYKDKFREKHDVNLGFMAFFVKACVEALKAFPVVNGRIDGNEIVTYSHYHIGVAVSTDKGLMVPVVHDADRKSFGQIEKTIAELAGKAREGRISVEDLQGGTFTITNGGVFGSLLSTPILYPGQSAILGMHTIQKRPVVVNDQVAIRPMMYLALSYDHRLIDGREAVQFLVRIKECIEDPERMLLEI